MDRAASGNEAVRIVLQISMSAEGTDRYKDIHVNIEVNREIGIPFITIERVSLSLRFFPALYADTDLQNSENEEVSEHNGNLGNAETFEDEEISEKAKDSAEAGDAQDFAWEDLNENHHDAQFSVSTASEASFSLARQWLSSCIEEHEACREECDSTSIIPSRLIDVGCPPDYGSVRLCAREEFGTKPQ